jgi:hypothetical protein
MFFVTFIPENSNHKQSSVIVSSFWAGIEVLSFGTYIDGNAYFREVDP